MDDEKTRQRELRAFMNFDNENNYKHKVITYDESNSLENIDIKDENLKEYINLKKKLRQNV